MLVEVFIKVMNGLMMTLEEYKRFLCVWLLYDGAKVSIKSHLMEIIFFSVLSAAAKC